MLSKMKSSMRPRSMTDAASGLSLNRVDYPGYSEEELAAHFKTFQQFDLDSTGFISPENLLDVLTAMKIEDASMQMVHLIIAEVSILTGHDNDGKLSFRDYMKCIVFDHEAAAHNLALDAQEELLVSVEEEEEHNSNRLSARSEAAPEEPSTMLDVSDGAAAAPSSTAPPPAPRPSAARGSIADPASPELPPPPSRMRRSSMSAVNDLAAARIKAFQRAADASAAADKLSAFRSTPRGLTPVSGPLVNSEQMAKTTLKNKVAAFETASRFKGTVELAKTWRQVGDSRTYKPATKVMAYDGAPSGPPPKRSLRDLP